MNIVQHGVHRKAMPSLWETVWEKKHTRTPVGDSGATAIYKGCFEKGKIDTVLHVRFHQSGAEGQNHLPRPAGLSLQGCS